MKKDKKRFIPDGPDFVAFAKLQTEFNSNFKSSFLYDKEPKKVSIKNLQRGRDTWVVRGLERDILDSLKNYLGALGDIRNRQTIVVTPLDIQGNLLKKEPSSWEKIKDGKFAIIDGQHSVEASKELQHEGVS